MLLKHNTVLDSVRYILNDSQNVHSTMNIQSPISSSWGGVLGWKALGLGWKAFWTCDYFLLCDLSYFKNKQ